MKSRKKTHKIATVYKPVEQTHYCVTVCFWFFFVLVFFVVVVVVVVVFL